MPVYVFRCPEGHVTDVVQSIHDDTPSDAVCVSCGQPGTRQFGAPLVKFRGVGWAGREYKNTVSQGPMPEGVPYA